MKEEKVRNIRAYLKCDTKRLHILCCNGISMLFKKSRWDNSIPLFNWNLISVGTLSWSMECLSFLFEMPRRFVSMLVEFWDMFWKRIIKLVYFWWLLQILRWQKKNLLKETSSTLIWQIYLQLSFNKWYYFIEWIQIDFLEKQMCQKCYCTFHKNIYIFYILCCIIPTTMFKQHSILCFEWILIKFIEKIIVFTTFQNKFT